QEFPARGRIEVEVLDLDRRPRRKRRGLDGRHGARLARETPGMTLAAAARGDRKPRDGADRRERLAAKAERRRALEVLERGDLARGESRDRERKVVAIDSRAVVDDAKPPDAALDEVDGDRLRAGVEA